MEKYIAFLQKLIDDLDEPTAKYGRTKAIRQKALNDIMHAVTLLENFLNSNNDLATLLLEYHNGNSYGYDETLSSKYIIRDVERFIVFLKDKNEDKEQ